MTNESYRTMQLNMGRLREEVLSRVRTVQRIRAFLASPASSATLVVVFLACASIFVSFGDIARNLMMHSEWSGRFSYTYSSLMHTRVIVQIFAGLIMALGLIFVTKLLSRTSFRLFKS